LELSKQFPGKADKFVASNGWLVRFRARYSIKFTNIEQENGAINTDIAGCEQNKEVYFGFLIALYLKIFVRVSVGIFVITIEITNLIITYVCIINRISNVSFISTIWEQANLPRAQPTAEL